MKTDRDAGGRPAFARWRRRTGDCSTGSWQPTGRSSAQTSCFIVRSMACFATCFRNRCRSRSSFSTSPVETRLRQQQRSGERPSTTITASTFLHRSLELARETLKVLPCPVELRCCDFVEAMAGWTATRGRGVDRNVASSSAAGGEGPTDERCARCIEPKWPVPDLGAHPARGRKPNGVARPVFGASDGLARHNRRGIRRRWRTICMLADFPEPADTLEGDGPSSRICPCGAAVHDAKSSRESFQILELTCRGARSGYKPGIMRGRGRAAETSGTRALLRRCCARQRHCGICREDHVCGAMPGSPPALGSEPVSSPAAS